MKWELEDLAFQALHPRKYAEIKAMVTGAARRPRGARARGGGRAQVELDKVDIPAEIVGRAKHFYSIYDKMAKKGREFNEIYDLTAMRVIVEREGDEGTRDCYGALGLIHSLWKPMPGRFKDFVAMPKVNRYRSLHTTVIGPRAGRSRSRCARAGCTRPQSSESRRTGPTRRGRPPWPTPSGASG
jgi:GTP pyrophosphokinase